RTQSKLDSLAWSAGLPFIAYGVRVGIRANSVELIQQSLGFLPLGWKPSSSLMVECLYSIVCKKESGSEKAASFHLFRNDQFLFRSSSADELFERLESDVALYVADATQKRVFVHAGVVGWGGRAILIPARSLSGKTTLVADLVRAGATYYSDEFAVIDQRGFIHPYARPLQVREPGSFRQYKRTVEEFGGTAGQVPLPVGLVLLTRYKAGSKWKPRHISAGRALLGILDNTVSARRGPALAMKTLRLVVTGSFAVQGVRGEGGEVVEWIASNFHPRRMFSTPAGIAIP
ncbi:MAG TPA: hypothetical protein VHX11_02340, partial [Acidobacteriaceae bacterium]|nr:hypothetical protein [Acidobacteriaceae bacterium]